MGNILRIKNDIKFYENLIILIKAVKAVAILQFHTLEKKIGGCDKFLESIRSFFELIYLEDIQHPFVHPQDAPVGVIAVTSETGLLGGLNNRIMYTALSYLKSPNDKLIIVGYQGQNFAKANHIPFKGFPSIVDEKRYSQAMALRDYIVEEVLNRRMGAVKIIYPFPISIIAHRILTLDLLPCTEWSKDKCPQYFDSNVLLESSRVDLIEYLSYLWIGHKIYEIFGYSRLAELSARINHLEGCTQKIEDMEKHLKIQYHKERHQKIDQQLRELFAARSLYG